jgi:hypothetical protein
MTRGRLELTNVFLEFCDTGRKDPVRTLSRAPEQSQENAAGKQES